MGRKLVLGVAGTIAVAVGIVGMVSGSETEGPLIPPSTSAERKALEAVLWDLKRNWKPINRARVLSSVADRADRLRRPLVGLLSQQSNVLLLEAIELAAALEVTEARQAIAQLAETGEERLRPGAILAAEKLEPWDRDQLGKFIKTGTPPVILAALEVAASREDRPLGEILSLFSHDTPQVRHAASNAIPTQLSPENLEELIAFAGSATEADAVYAIRALGRSEIPPAVEAFLVEQIDYPVRSIRMAALEALTHKGSSLQHGAILWKFVREGFMDVKERAKAFVCLERTESFEVFEIRDALPDLPPYLKYFAARCLVAAGEREGVGILIDLVENGADGIGLTDRDDAQAVVFAARKLLADLSKIGLHAQVDELREWYHNLEGLRPTTLLPPELDL